MSDLISRQAAIDALDKELSAKYAHREMAVSFLGAKRIIETVPSAQTEQTVDLVKHGMWVVDWFQVGNAIPKYICSECGYYNGTARTNFCPNCGARMDGDEE